MTNEIGNCLCNNVFIYYHSSPELFFKFSLHMSCIETNSIGTTSCDLSPQIDKNPH